MKLLFVSTVPVFPPIDGVRIPPASYIEGLSKSHEVDFLLLENVRQEADWQETADAVHGFWKTPIRRKSKLAGIAREMLCQGPYYGNWEFTTDLPAELKSNQYDAVFACTPPAIALLARSEIRKRFPSVRLWIAAMSDVHSLVVAQQSVNASKNHTVWARLVHRVVYGLRTRILARNEMSMLQNYQRVFAQTEKECDWIHRKGGDALSEKTVQLTNAVHEDLFSLPVERTGRSVVFVGSMTGLYGERFRWFVHNVWKHVDASQEGSQKGSKEGQQEDQQKGMTMHAVGRGANEVLLKDMAENKVEYISYVESLSDIYRDHDILVAPIFKGYGLINKVVEAMAAGCIVVGDETAFNGIPEFVAGKHGLVANSKEEFVEVLRGLSSDNQSLNEIRQDARQLMEKHFRWSQRVETIEETLRAL